MADLLQTLLPVAGAAAGAFGGPQGMVIGGALGQAAATGLAAQNAEDPNFQGATAAQKQIQSAQLSNIEKMQSQQGLSAQDVARINQTIGQTAEQQLAAIQAMPQTLTPLERQRLTKALTSRAKALTASVGERIAALDPAAEAKRLAAISQATGIAQSNAAAIQQAEARKQQMEMALEQQRAQAFNQSMQGIVKAIGVAGELDDTWGDDEDEDDATSGFRVTGDEAGTSSNGIINTYLQKSYERSSQADMAMAQAQAINPAQTLQSVGVAPSSATTGEQALKGSMGALSIFDKLDAYYGGY